MKYFYIALGIVVLWGIYAFNRFVSLKNRAEEAWADIEVQLKRRYDLIPNLVNTVKGYATHEQSAFENVTKARSAAMGVTGPTEAHAQAENILTGALKSVFALAEAYPDLKANQNFLALQNELSDTKNKIQAALTDALDIMKIGKISDEAGLTKALENIDIAMSGIQAIFDYITQIKELQASWQDIIDKNTMTDAEYQLKQLNKWYEEQTALANSLGMNLGVLNQAYKVQVDQIKATSQSLDVNPMIQLVKDYLDFVNNIQFSDLAPVQSVEQYQNRYNELLGLSRSGDTDATNSLMDFVSSQYLPFLKNFTGDETDYKDLYNELFGPSGTLRNLVVSTSDVLVDGEKIGAGILKAIEPYLIPGEGGINLTIKIGDKTISDLVVSAIRSGDVELISAIGSV